MSKRLETLAETDTIERAAQVMRDSGVGFLPICGANRKVIGVVTDRDLVTRALARGLDPKTTSAAMIMTSPALTCLADADLREAEELMGQQRLARLVVMDGEGTAVGVISVADLVEHAPARQALRAVKSVLWREALGPRGGASKNQRLLRDYPLARETAERDDEARRPTVFMGGQHDNGAKEFPS
jgi:CBS-domain-containing membrane protein